MNRAWLSLLFSLSFAPSALAQTGVSDDRISVPDGPGSIEGLGDNTTVEGNMGLASYGVPFELPRGFEGATPTLALSYASGNGNGIAGLGWAMHVPSIERLTLRGLPSYVAGDEFVANGSSQLVRVSTSGGDAVYRERFEGGFVRYVWHGVGAAGYWTAEHPDGSTSYFGATADGTLVPSARLTGPDGEVFRYHLVERIDVYGHRIRYSYTVVGGSPYLTRIEYAHDAGGTARYAVELTYETRTDVISDCKPGFEEKITQRLVGVAIRVNGERIRRYALSYDPPAASGGLSRLAKVERFGRSDGLYPVVFTFGYSRVLGDVCETCDGPFVVDMGSLPTGGAIASGDATLVDLNGDALPDVVDASAPGAHVFAFNRLQGEGRSSFDPTTQVSAVGTRSAFQVSLPNVEPLDVNGDGFADLVNTATGNVLCNTGTGDWSTSSCVPPGGFGFVLNGSQSGIRFTDVDGDRRVDVLRTASADLLEVFRNTGTGFEVLTDVEAIGAAFDEDQLQLADLNADGLLDAVEIDGAGNVRYRASLGRGKWRPWLSMSGPQLSASQREGVALEDLNGDGLDDLVFVSTNAVQYALNRAGASFEALVTIDGSDVPSLPSRLPETTILYADMNASGSVDVVWVHHDGDVEYLELFPVLPNLLSRIENGLGMVQELSYGTAVGQRRADEVAWTHRLTIPANVVTRVDTWTKLTGGENGVGLHEVTEYRYRDGFYDGAEKQFRGFVRVENRMLADTDRDSQEAGRTFATYDVGATDVYRNGRMLTQASFGGEPTDERPLSEIRVSYEDCPLADVPDDGLRFEVRFVCERSRTTISQEGAAPAEWATMRTEQTYDGYGQVTLAANLGVVHRGPPEAPTTCGACTRDASAFGEACGAGCLGDESYVATDRIAPGGSTGGRWILGRAKTERRSGVQGGLSTETRTYYDGPAFVGLPLGSLTLGAVTRVSSRRVAGVDDFVDQQRFARDAHGNVVGQLDPDGSVADTTGHRRSYLYDAIGLRMVRSDVHLVSPEGAPYVLRRDVAYDPAFDQVTEATGFMFVEGSTNRSARNATRMRYDEFGRRVAIIRPGDTDQAPTVEYTWELASPASRILERSRTVRGGVADLERSTCIDGRGRTFQSRIRVDGARYQVDGFVEHNSRGAALRSYQPYLAETGACDTSPPTNVLYEDVRYDVAFREIGRTRPDAELHGSASTTAIQYGPLTTSRFDEDDRDAASPHADTPTVTHRDGLGRVVAVERRLTPTGPAAFTRAEYDALGRLSAIVDAEGHRKTQTHDLLARVLSIDDPSSGETALEYDAVGNVLARTDARGITTRFSYDGANRVLAEWNDADLGGTQVRIRYDRGGGCDPANCTNAEGRTIEIDFPIDPVLHDRLGGGARGADHFGFDARGQSVYEARTVAGIPLVTRQTFDDAGRVVERAYPDGRSLEFQHDGASRPIAIEGVVDAVDYDERGLPTRVERANGATESWTYDVLGRNTERTVATALDVPLVDVAYERDRTGHGTRIVDVAAPADGWEALDARFIYDAWYRVVEATYEGRGGGSETQHRSYDRIDNLISSTSTTGASSIADLGELGYDATRPNAVVSVGGLQLRYDDAGYLTQRGDLELEWDHAGRLVRGARADATVVRLSYAAGTSRVATIEGDSVTLYAGKDFELRDGVGVLYARLGEQRIARLESSAIAADLLGDAAPVEDGDREINVADAWVAHAGRADLLDATVPTADPSVLLRSAGRRMLAEAGDAIVALHADALGSLVAATDAEGAERGRRRFLLPAGEDRASGFVDVYGFSGQEQIESLGLVRFEHRWLDPITQRWTRPDPAFEHVDALTALRSGESANRYAYVGNDFVNHVDPTGLTTELEIQTVEGWAGTPTAGLPADGHADIQARKVQLAAADPESPAHRAAGRGVMTRLDINGRTFYGVNAHGRQAEVAAGVNAISPTHAEGHVTAQALADPEARAGVAHLWVDAELCGSCGRFRGVDGLARQLGVHTLHVHTPNGVQIRPTGLPIPPPPAHEGGGGGGGGGAAHHAAAAPAAHE